MIDYLREYCQEFNIKLVYTKNKYVVLSTGINKGRPTIRAHEIFRGCPQNIAYAIVDYYTQFKNSEKHLHIIKSFVEELSDFEKYIIKTNDKEVNKLMNYQSIFTNKEELSLEEINITKIIQKDFKGVVSQLNPQDPIKTSENDVLELDILIDPF